MARRLSILILGLVTAYFTEASSNTIMLADGAVLENPVVANVENGKLVILHSSGVAKIHRAFWDYRVHRDQRAGECWAEGVVHILDRRYEVTTLLLEDRLYGMVCKGRRWLDSFCHTYRHEGFKTRVRNLESRQGMGTGSLPSSYSIREGTTSVALYEEEERYATGA